MTVTDADIAHVLDLERELQTPQTRANVGRLSELLAPNFIEVGASGRRWNFDAILGLLTQEADVADNVGIDIIGLEARVLTGDFIQVFWDSERDGRRARRTSLWQRTPEAWQQTYHQGTLLP